MDRLEEIERNGRDRAAIRTTHTQPRELGSSGQDGSPPSEVYVRPTSSVEEPERRWSAQPSALWVAPEGSIARAGASVEASSSSFQTTTAYANSHLPYNDVRGCDEFIYDVAPNENRFVGRDFIVNDANVENMVETNTRDDLYDDLLRNEVNEANGRLIEAQRRGQNDLYKLNDERMPLHLQYTQARDIITVANRPYHIIDQWPPQTHHYMSTDHSQYDPVENATEMGNVRTRQSSEARGMPRMQNGFTVTGPSEYRPRSTNERTGEMATQNSMQRSDLDLFNGVHRPEQRNSVERSVEFLQSRSYLPASSILPSQRTQSNNIPITAPMRHLTNAWPTLNHVAAQNYNPINSTSYSLARAMSPQSNHVHLPNVINKNSVATQTYNSDTVLTLNNVSTAAANVKEGEIEGNKCSLRHGEALSVDKCLTTEFDCDVKHRAGKDNSNAYVLSKEPQCVSVLKGTLAPSAKQREITDDGYSSSTDIAAEQRADNDLRGILRREGNAGEASARNVYVYEQGEQILSTLNCQERPCRKQAR